MRGGGGGGRGGSSDAGCGQRRPVGARQPRECHAKNMGFFLAGALTRMRPKAGHMRSRVILGGAAAVRRLASRRPIGSVFLAWRNPGPRRSRGQRDRQGRSGRQVESRSGPVKASRGAARGARPCAALARRGGRRTEGGGRCREGTGRLQGVHARPAAARAAPVVAPDGPGPQQAGAARRVSRCPAPARRPPGASGSAQARSMLCVIT